jgi:hypothetical protein
MDKPNGSSLAFLDCYVDLTLDYLLRGSSSASGSFLLLSPSLRARSAPLPHCIFSFRHLSSSVALASSSPFDYVAHTGVRCTLPWAIVSSLSFVLCCSPLALPLLLRRCSLRVVLRCRL